MKLTSSVKEIYAQSEENIILTDAELNVIWKNHGDLPDVIDISALCDTPENAFILPVEKTATFEYKGRFGHRTSFGQVWIFTLQIEFSRQHKDGAF